METEAVLGNTFSAFMHFTTYVPAKCPIGCIISEAECPGQSETVLQHGGHVLLVCISLVATAIMISLLKSRSAWSWLMSHKRHACACCFLSPSSFRKNGFHTYKSTFPQCKGLKTCWPTLKVVYGFVSWPYHSEVERLWVIHLFSLFHFL